MEFIAEPAGAGTACAVKSAQAAKRCLIPKVRRSIDDDPSRIRLNR
jgi:hypothetical protein